MDYWNNCDFDREFDIIKLANIGKIHLVIGGMMEESNESKKNDFLYPRSRYYGEFKPENLVFNANLQEFAQKIGFISGLETAGKIDTYEAYHQIKSLWKQLKKSKQELGIGEEPPVSS